MTFFALAGAVTDVNFRTQVDSKIEEVKDKIAKLGDYKIQLDGLTAIHTAHETAIAQARRWCDQHTKSDIINIKRESKSDFSSNSQGFIIAHPSASDVWYERPEPANRCIGDYESLQTLHQWKIDFLRADRLEMTYSDEIRLCIDCTNFIPNTSTKEIVLVQSKEKEVEHPMTESLFELLKAGLKSRSKSTLPQVSPTLLTFPSPPARRASQC